MAWIRTAVAMIAFGYATYRFLAGMEGVRPGTPRTVGLFLVSLGTFSVLVGCLDYWQVMRLLHRETGHRSRKLPLIVALLVSGLGLGLIVWITVVASR